MEATSISEINKLVAENKRLRATLMSAERNGPLVFVLDRKTCDWVIDEKRDTAICRTHGEICDGVDSEHFPGNKRRETSNGR